MSYQSQLDTAIEAARTGGDFLRRAFHGGRNHVAAEAGQDLRRILLGRFPDYGYLGDKTGQVAVHDRDRHLWLVGPMDGTRAFESGHRGPCVSVALLRNGVPVLGVVYAFSWPDDDGDLFAWAQGLPSLLRNGSPVAFDADEAPPTLATSQDADKMARLHAELAQPLRYRPVASLALRLALVAAGEAQAGNSMNGPCGRDYGAGHALLRASGLRLLDDRGREVTYSADGESSCGGCCTGGPETLARQIAARNWDRVYNEPKDQPQPYDLCWPDRRRLVADAGLLRRAHGCLLGQLAGDALGALVEFESPELIAARYPQGVRRMEDGGTHSTIAGQPTDDSEMALMLARAVLQKGRYDADAVARAYSWWLGTDPFDVGNTVAAGLAGGLAVLRENTGDVADACRRAANPASEANGALMRVAPLGILGAGASPGRAATWADEDSRLTHPNAVCRHANSVFAASLAFAIREGADGRATHEFALREARRIGAHPSVAQALEQAVRQRPRSYTVNQGHVILALHNAFHQALHAGSLEEGIVDTISRGGDTDTNAAIAGALLGAIHGRTAIPLQWLDRVLTCRPIAGMPGIRRPRPKALWPVDALTLAEQLLWLGRQLD